MYLAIRTGTPPPFELTRVQVCERMGWTFAYYDTLDWSEVLGLLQVWDGMIKARNR